MPLPTFAVLALTIRLGNVAFSHSFTFLVPSLISHQYIHLRTYAKYQCTIQQEKFPHAFHLINKRRGSQTLQQTIWRETKHPTKKVTSMNLLQMS